MARLIPRDFTITFTDCPFWLCPSWLGDIVYIRFRTICNIQHDHDHHHHHCNVFTNYYSARSPWYRSRGIKAAYTQIFFRFEIYTPGCGFFSNMFDLLHYYTSTGNFDPGWRLLSRIWIGNEYTSIFRSLGVTASITTKWPKCGTSGKGRMAYVTLSAWWTVRGRESDTGKSI